MQAVRPGISWWGAVAAVAALSGCGGSGGGDSGAPGTDSGGGAEAGRPTSDARRPAGDLGSDPDRGAPPDVGTPGDAGPLTPPPRLVTSPLHREAGVSVRRESVVTLDRAVDRSTVAPDAFFATAAGEPLAGHVHIDPSGHRLTLFYDHLLPGGARVRVTLDGDAIRTEDGEPLDADTDGVPGGRLIFDFDTQGQIPIPGTAFVGRVLASERAGGQDVALPGVVVTVDGLEETARATTDADGAFRIEPVPVGRVFVHLNGQAVARDGGYYPFVGKAWAAKPGLENDAGTVYLPFIAAGTLQPVSREAETVVGFPESVRAGRPELEGVALTVPPDSLFSDDGSRGGTVGIAPVAPDRLPGALPEGWQFPVVITVQTNGPQNFDKPVGVCFPNLPDPGTGAPLEPGARNVLYSYDHDKGEWLSGAPMQVSADGRRICTAAGTGIAAPGWHASGAPPIGPSGGGGCNGGGGDGTAFKDAAEASCEPCSLPCVNECNWREAGCRLTYTSMAFFPCLAAGGLGGLPGRVGCLVLFGAWQYGICRASQCKRSVCGCQPGDTNADKSAMDVLSRLDPSLPHVLELLDEAIGLATPFAEAGTPVPAEIQARIDERMAAAEAAAGAPLPTYLQEMQRRLDQDDSAASGRTNAPAERLAYAAIGFHDTGATVFRGWTEPRGQFTLFVPRGLEATVMAFAGPGSRFVGTSAARRDPAGDRVFDPVHLSPGTAASDGDGDGIADIAEVAFGTDPANPDSDGDGVTDGAEVDQGSDPMDGRLVVTGVIGAADSPGTALDACVEGDLAAVADGEAGVALFDVRDPQGPVRTGQVALPGTATRVACEPGRVFAVSGVDLHFIDASDPPAARVTRTASLGGNELTAVATDGGVVYVGARAGFLGAFDAATGDLLETASFPEAVADLAVDRDTLIAVGPSRLATYGLFPAFGDARADIAHGSFAFGLPGEAPRRVSAGGGWAYVSTMVGPDVFDLSDPTAPRRTAAATDDGQFNNFKRLVPTGSGDGIAAAGARALGDGTQHVALYDLRDPARTNRLTAVLSTAGITYSVVHARGLAFAADGPSGLAVLNPMPQDTGHTPPEIALSGTFLPAAAVEVGTRYRVTADVRDDNQVREVRFFIDGEQVAADASFPFELRRTAPEADFTLQAAAVDTGGNVARSPEVRVTVSPDATPPALAHTNPRDGRLAPEGATRILAAFSEPLVADSVGPNTLVLVELGPDGQADTPDDASVALDVTYDPVLALLVGTSAIAFPGGRYRATLAPTLADAAGNRLTGDRDWEFTVPGGAPPPGDCGGAGQRACARQAAVFGGGGASGCAVLGSGVLKCWGEVYVYEDGQFHGDAPGESGAALPAVDLGTGRRAVQVAEVTDDFGCARLDDGTVKCWGFVPYMGIPLDENAEDLMLGDTPGEMGDALPALAIDGDRRAVDLCVGTQHGCVVLDDGAIKCWGSNRLGQLGQPPDEDDHRNPLGGGPDGLVTLDVGAGRRAAAVRCSPSHTCALLEDGAVRCFGGSPNGAYLTPVGRDAELGVGVRAVAIDLNRQTACVVLDDGRAKCWTPDNVVGLGPRGDELLAVPLGDAARVTEVSVFETIVGHTNQCFRLDDGTVKCTPETWWPRAGGAPVDLANPQPDGSHWPPIDLGAGRQATGLATGNPCVWLDDGHLKCVGPRVCGLPQGCVALDAAATGDDVPPLDLE